MIGTEPIIRAGILGATDTRHILHGDFCRSEEPDGSVLLCPLSDDSFFTLPEVKIGIGFHWERTEPQSFRGALRIHPDGLLVNEVAAEEYLRSVISSEMKATAPSEFLKAHAILSRSWLMAMIERERRDKTTGETGLPGGHIQLLFDKEFRCREISSWYDREAHTRFDVCTDDHCQRYQGISREISPAADKAVRETRGIVLSYGGEVCDARFSKCCGGVTEEFPTAWEAKDVPYLKSVSDIAPDGTPYCATDDRRLLETILNGYDLDSPDFFNWKETIAQEELSRLIKEKTGVDTGAVIELRPLSRGKSGRIHRLLIRGSKETIIVGKELEIRRVLSHTHLKSSAFEVMATDRNGSPVSPGGIPEIFILSGRGWGHGVGLCQIGAAAMASRGFDHKSILNHYFTDAVLIPLYR